MQNSIEIYNFKVLKALDRKLKCDKKLGCKTNKTKILYILNDKYILKVSHSHELETTYILSNKHIKHCLLHQKGLEVSKGLGCFDLS
jgi:hypothetical protein